MRYHETYIKRLEKHTIITDKRKDIIMQINSVNFGTSRCPKPCSNTSFGDKGSGTVIENIIDRQNARTRSIKETIPTALETIEKLNTDINRITYETAIDYRMRIAKEAKEKLEVLKQIISRLR